jgi:hypothetical protein
LRMYYEVALKSEGLQNYYKNVRAVGPAPSLSQRS